MLHPARGKALMLHVAPADLQPRTQDCALRLLEPAGCPLQKTPVKAQAHHCGSVQKVHVTKDNVAFPERLEAAGPAARPSGQAPAAAPRCREPERLLECEGC